MNRSNGNQAHTKKLDPYYTRFAFLYEGLVKIVPAWRRWIRQAAWHASGSKILEISFGPGHLFEYYLPGSQVVGLEYNRKMLEIAKRKTGSANPLLSLVRGDVYDLPLKSEIFDTVVNTMAFTGYRDGKRAMEEMNRVLKPGGKLVIVDINFPGDRNRLGTRLTQLWAALGDIIRDMDPLFRNAGFHYVDKEIGGWGSVHLYIAVKRTRSG